ncbi:MAG: hypothetical protein QM831_24260 [Kofleriaceae bacterium]
MPFLVTYGSGLWVAILGLFVLLVLAIAWLIRRRWATNEARARVTTLARDPKALRGILRGEPLQSHYEARRWGITVETEAPPPVGAYLDTEEGKVIFDGNVRVDAGTFARSRRRFRKVRYTSMLGIAVGDPVIAIGELLSTPSQDRADYRESAGIRVLRGPITVAALHPARNHTPITFVAVAVTIMISSWVGYEVLDGQGQRWRNECWHYNDPDKPGPHVALSNTDVCVLANMMPGQNDALAAFSQNFTAQPIANHEELVQHLEVARTLESCSVSLEVARHVLDPQVLLDEATRCADLEARQEALVELGRFDEAAAMGPIDRHVGTTMVLGHRWDDAASYAHHLARISRQAADPDSAQHWDCVGELMSWYGGDQAALGRLLDLSPNPNCKAELAAMTTGDIHALIIAGDQMSVERLLLDRDLPRQEQHVLDVERMMEGVPPVTPSSILYVLTSSTDFSAVISPSLLWATTFATTPKVSKDDDFALYNYEMDRIVPAAFDGDLAVAHVHAAAAREALKSLEKLPPELGAVDAVIDLRSMKIDTAYKFDADLPTFPLKLRKGEPIEREYLRTNPKVLAAATAGDVKPLLDAINSRLGHYEIQDLIAIMPRIAADKRAAIAQAVRWNDQFRLGLRGGWPWSALEQAADRRTFFELANDPDDAAMWATIYKRFRDVFVTPHMLVALTEWDGD